MGILNRLFGWKTEREEISRSCDVDFYEGAIYVVCICKYFGYGGQLTPPMIKLDSGASPAEIGEATLEVLKESKGWLPEAERVNRFDEFLKFLGAKNWRDYERSVDSLGIHDDGELITITPLYSKKGYLTGDVKHKKKCGREPREIGETILELRPFCKPGPKKPVAAMKKVENISSSRERASIEPKGPNENLNDLMRQLDAMGFFSYVDEAGRTKALEDYEKYELVLSDESRRVFSTDAEALAEGDVLEFIEDEIASFLKGAGVDLETLELDQDFEIGGGYTLSANGKEYVLYSKEECESEEIWDLCPRRAFGLINSWLERAGSDERLYMLYGGNDLQAVFLTTEMFALISTSDAMPEREKPVDVGVFGNLF